MEIEEFKHLWLKYLDKEASEEEVKRLLEFIRLGKANEYLKQFITTLDSGIYPEIELQESEWRNLWDRVQTEIDPAGEMNVIHKEKAKPGYIEMFLRYGGWAVAAAVIIIFSTSNFFNGNNNTPPTATPQQVTIKKDVPAPGSVNAVLTLADGTSIILDSIENGEVAKQPGTSVIKLPDGKILYHPQHGSMDKIQYNTLTVPRGSRIVNLILSDGSSVMLNAASSIRYPTVFTGKQREVEITGEGYFEVAKNKAMPFVVRKGNTRVEVLGTHFNVNAYDDEDFINVTLLEGLVKVSQLSAGHAASYNVILMPGQMAQVKDSIQLVSNVNLEEVMAWKIGKFKFGEYASIEMVMRQISRWYNIEVEYRGKIKGHIGGTISREVNVSEVLSLLEMTGAVTFQYDGKKIIVMQKK